MPETREHFIAILNHLENDLVFGEALFFPEVSCLGESSDAVVEQLSRQVRHIFANSRPAALPGRRLIVDPRTGVPQLPDLLEIEIDVPPPRKDAHWIEALKLKFAVCVWQHGTHRIGYVPRLGIEVVCDKPARFEEMVVEHIQSALQRMKSLRSLDQVLRVERVEDLSLESCSVYVTRKTAREVAVASDNDTSESKEYRKAIAVANPGSQKPAYEIDRVVQDLAERLGGSQPRSVLVVGKPGVGKTAAFDELVRRSGELGLDGPFWKTSGARLVSGMSGFGMWQERCQQLCEAARKENAILHLGNLQEVAEVGRSVGNDQGIVDFLAPRISQGEFLAVAECTPEQLAVLEASFPRLIEALDRLDIDEPGGVQGLRILQRVADVIGRRRDSRSMTKEAIEETQRLHKRYATYSGFPGRPIRFLRGLTERSSEATPLGLRDVVSAFSDETGLPLVLLDDTEPLRVADLEAWFASRLIGQDDAIHRVVGLISTVKAALTRPERPIASLLFAGPTGVGKTETAKCLAEYLFGDRQRMTRFDMSEYSDVVSIRRLTGGVFGQEGLLTAKVREQPFSVVLLDEVEKAHPLFFDLLLQILGEGRLTDAAGRVADFCNAVVIMTSNLGAESFQQGSVGFLSSTGQSAGSAELANPDHVRQHFVEALRGAIRPELFNRIDEVVAFQPLSLEAIRKISKRELSAIAKRDGALHGNLEVRFGDGVGEYLGRLGFDARYGARPLKRRIEQELLVRLADISNEAAAGNQVVVDVALDEDRSSGGDLVFSTTTIAGAEMSLAAKRVEPVIHARRMLDLLGRCRPMHEIRTSLQLASRRLRRYVALEARLDRQQKDSKKKLSSWKRAEMHKERGLLERQVEELSAVQKHYDALRGRVEEEELQLHLELYSRSPESEPTTPTPDAEWKRRVRDAILQVYCVGQGEATVLFQFQAKAEGRAQWLAQLYKETLEKLDDGLVARVQAYEGELAVDVVPRHHPSFEKVQREANAYVITPVVEFRPYEPGADTNRLYLIEVTGAAGRLLVQEEQGSVDVHDGSMRDRCRVQVLDLAVADLTRFAEQACAPYDVRKLAPLGEPLVADPFKVIRLQKRTLTAYGREFRWTGRDVVSALESSLEERLSRAVMEVLER